MKRGHEPQFVREGGGGGRFERMFLSSRLFNQVVTGVGKVVLTGMVWPRYVAPFRWELTRYRMGMKGIGRGLEGLRILHLTDLHLGATRVKYLEGLVRRCLEERPELVVITGDLLDYGDTGGLAELGGILRMLVKEAGEFGVAAVFGNHDYREYSWRHVGKRSAGRAVHRRLVKVVEESGVRLLRNEQYRVRRGGSELVVVGMDEMWAGRADAGKAFGGVKAGEAVLCLQHNPDGVEELKGYPWRWMLCGHSHGGQAVFPVVGAMFLPMKHREYLRGMYGFRPVEGQGEGERWMFVSRGVGYSFPIRVRCRPEATVFTVVGI